MSLFPDRPLRDYSTAHLERIYEWAAREKKEAVSNPDADSQHRYYRLYDIQAAANEELERRRTTE